MLGSSSYEFNTTMECRDRGSDDDHSIMGGGGGGYNNISLLRNGRGGEFGQFFLNLFMTHTQILWPFFHLILKVSCVNTFLRHGWLMRN